MVALNESKKEALAKAKLECLYIRDFMSAVRSGSKSPPLCVNDVKLKICEIVVSIVLLIMGLCSFITGVFTLSRDHDAVDGYFASLLGIVAIVISMILLCSRLHHRMSRPTQVNNII